jgi:class 3 adenylate cyclase/tetratricopeptide (TPR) repeat protein/nucleoside-triphosphatase THEP1
VPSCPGCRRHNPEGFRFCGHCGSPLAQLSCPSCGWACSAGQRFCGRCGAALAPAPAPEAGPGELSSPVEERKLATVLFADVVGFTSLAERTDPEVVARMVDAALSELASVVVEHGGTVDKYMGDSLMAIFGVPVTHDDDAERAVAAALAMRGLGGDLVFAIGVNTGEVMVGAPGGGGTTVIGDAVNVAARLEKAATPGEVLCGPLTVELARDRVEFEERRAVLLKGKREPVEVWAALRLRRDAGEAPAREQPALVGRGEEVAFLHNELRRVSEDSRSSLVVVCGEAGSGKTRLLEELAERAGSGARVVRAAYPTYGMLGGRQVAAELIAQLGASADPDVEARVRSVLGELDPSLRAIDAAGIEREQLWALGRLVKEKALEQPLLVIIDDLHAADDRTLELIAQLSRHLRDHPLLTVVAGRSEPAGWLARFAAATTLRLRPLTRAQAEQLAEEVLGAPLAGDALAFFTDRAKGNPLYLRELMALARQRGLLDTGDGGYRLLSEKMVPASLKALLAARLDALERPQKLAFQHLALLGQASPAELGTLGVAEAPAALGTLLDLGLVRLGPDGDYEPSDPLLAEVAYDMLPRRARGELHRRAGHVLARPEARLGHLEKAAAYLPEDGELAAEAAEALATEGLAMLEGFRQPDALALLERSVALGMRRPEVLLALAPMQAGSGKAGEAQATLALIPDDPDDPALGVERDHAAAAAKVFSDPAGAVAGLLEAAGRWRALGNVGKEAWAHANAGVALFFTSQMTEAAEELDRGLELFESVGDRSGAMATAGFLCLARPEDPRVDRLLAEVLAFADETGDRNKKAGALATLGWKHYFRSHLGSAAQTAEAEGTALRLSELASELGLFEMALEGHCLRALMARSTGRLEVARAEIEAMGRLPRSPSQRRENWLAWAVSFDVALATDDPEEAVPFPHEDSVDPVEAMASRIVDGALVLAGRLEEALERRGRDQVSFKGPIADATEIVHAMALVFLGDAERARHLLARAGSAAEVLGAEGVGRAARALQAELDGRMPAPEPLPEGPSLSGALVLRARHLAGDARAGDRLRRMAEALCAPGLLAGVAATSRSP